jgi:hypothetical protein
VENVVVNALPAPSRITILLHLTLDDLAAPAGQIELGTMLRPPWACESSSARSVADLTASAGAP